MLYTRKGDSGTTKTFGCDQRISKSSTIAEALGSLDEINSFLGLCKVKARKEKLLIGKLRVDQMVHDIQKNLFIVQAELAGASMCIEEAKIKEVESIIDAIEKELPPIKSFFVSGGTELASIFDIARGISRRAERSVIRVKEEGKTPITDFTLAYLNRLSSLLYAFARFANYKAGITEESPDYK
ncbi:MAG: ATP/cobalamin adenosyltransferase [Parcubacteria group bacterium GW2011_GWF2_38_8]|nr:MAG: ATP/cobalamin adenosyltransferase [Parcubacteria group bacterium GW2011_GWF2_38_8]